ncbi:MAG: MBL fold metallo-hydrolase, partial [Nanoarchaeota archaeon]|nr:MBL fold metallo-hydrolase [Nanoarchaeota archaeon]MBU1598193.1 MBL fold metallo-hydrolase [Nanoarchaeota archaeon]MBU2441323.1 MBL fold metallo-hydrolase [Nanoarchaeota archaeon]
MGLQIIPVGGYSEIGRNCTLVKVDDEAVILDMGLHMDNYIAYTDDLEELHSEKDMTAKTMIRAQAVPNINQIHDLWPKVKAICITHAHLDHLGAVPFLSNKFKADIHCTRYTAEVLSAILKDDEINLRNNIVMHPVNSKFKISKKITIEFINMTHSIPQTVIIAVHTPYGTVVYANDFKLDNAPTLGEKPNYKGLQKIGEDNVKVLILDSLYAGTPMKTPSESIAKEMLKDVLLGVNSEGKAVIVTTFSSHIARLKSIFELSIKLKRQIVFIGRSLSKYITAAERAGIIDFSKKAEFVRYGNKVKKFFGKIKKPEKYLFVVTGHQGEPRAILPRMLSEHLYDFKEEDHVIFSCSIIPVEANIRNRDKLDNELKRKKVRLFTGVHVSGHAFREDQRDLIKLLKPEYIIPTHADVKRLEAMKELALQMGY